LTTQSDPLHGEGVENLTKLFEITENLNRSVDTHSALDSSLAKLVQLMELESGWIFLKDPTTKASEGGPGYVLTSCYNLPPALATDKEKALRGGCKCQGLCDKGHLTGAYNEVRCSRLASVHGDRRGLRVHASAPLRSGDSILGILNVAGPNWTSFNSQALALLSNVGSQMGLALERARLFDLLQERHIQEQRALLDVSNQLLRRRDLDELTTYLVEEARRLLRVDACALLLPSKEPGYLAFSTSAGWRGDPNASQRKVPINEQSGAGQVMSTQQPLLVEDIKSHDPTSWIPDWIKAEDFRGHALVPLVAEDRAIGILAINTREPRILDEGELRFLRVVANQAAIAIEKARLHQEEIQQHLMEHELTVAQQIQLSLLPQSNPVYPGWEFSTYYQAARRVSGDFYDFFELPGEPGRLGMVIADVAGKGVPAALFMVHCRIMIRTSALSGNSPSVALTQANELILRDNKSDIFVTAFYGILDTRSNRFDYTNAGHNRPLWMKAATNDFKELSARGIILGSFEEVKLEEQTIEVAPSDLLVFYTDGVTEARNDSGELFGIERLKNAVASHSDAGAKEILQEVVQAINTFAGDTPQSDDFTLYVVKRKPNK